MHGSRRCHPIETPIRPGFKVEGGVTPSPSSPEELRVEAGIQGLRRPICPAPPDVTLRALPSVSAHALLVLVAERQDKAQALHHSPAVGAAQRLGSVVHGGQASSPERDSRSTSTPQDRNDISHSGCPQLQPNCCDSGLVQVSHLHSNQQRLTAQTGCGTGPVAGQPPSLG